MRSMSMVLDPICPAPGPICLTIVVLLLKQGRPRRQVTKPLLRNLSNWHVRGFSFCVGDSPKRYCALRASLDYLQRSEHRQPLERELTRHVGQFGDIFFGRFERLAIFDDALPLTGKQPR